MKRFLKSVLASFTTPARQQPRASLRVEALEDRFALSPVSAAVVAHPSNSAVRQPVVAGPKGFDAVIPTGGNTGSNGGSAPPAPGSTGGSMYIPTAQWSAGGIIASHNPVALKVVSPQPAHPAVRGW
jgi:hypothetical protein